MLDSKEIFLKIPSGYFNYSMHLFKYNLIYSVKFTVFADFVYFARKYEDLLLKKLPNLNSTYDNFFSSKNPSSLRLRYIFTSINFSQNFERIVEQTSTSQSRDIFNLNFRIDLWLRNAFSNMKISSNRSLHDSRECSQKFRGNR